MAADGRTVLFSSHILEEVEQVAGSIQVMVAGRHAASGDYREIRRLMTERPHLFTVRSSDDRALGAAILGRGHASGVTLVAGVGGRARAGAAPNGGPAPAVGPAAGPGAGQGTEAALHIETSDYGGFVTALPSIARGLGVRLYEVSPADESLESVFSYLVSR